MLNIQRTNGGRPTNDQRTNGERLMNGHRTYAIGTPFKGGKRLIATVTGNTQGVITVRDMLRAETVQQRIRTRQERNSANAYTVTNGERDFCSTICSNADNIQQL